MPQAVNQGQDFWEKVRQNVRESDREVQRVSKYKQLRELGFTSKEARKMRDWSQVRIDLMRKF